LKILLISPSTEDDIISKTVKEIPYLDSGAFFAPHALATVAALTPEGHQIRLYDEHMHGPVDELLKNERFDIIGISLITNQLHRVLSIAEFCKRNGVPGCLVIGGIGTANVMQRLKDAVDVIFIGEAEGTWPAFLDDFAKGRNLRTYQQISKPDMRKSPVPRWDLIREDVPKYGTVSVQTSRGCPHDCSFCDVIYTYGRVLRSKSVDQVLEEIALLYRLGAKMIMIADDNFTAPRAYAKEILRKLKAINNSFLVPMIFITQVDITIANDDELLELLADSNFLELQIGIESFNAESLKHMNKNQNLTVSIPDAVRKIQSYGIAVQSHLIIGSDADTVSTFAHTAEFVSQAHIMHHSCHPLQAPPGTRLWYELKRKGRIVETDDRLKDQLDITSNIIPLNMTRIEMMEGMADYWDTVSRVTHYLPRALGFLAGVRRKPEVKEPGFQGIRKQMRMILKIFRFYLIGAGREHRKAFMTLLKTAQKTGRYLIPRVIFLYTRFMMDRIRDANSAKVARAQAKWERDNPNSLTVLSDSVPVSMRIREQHREIFRAAYERVRPRVRSKERLYRIVLEAMIDYTERYGEALDTFDDVQRGYVRQCCDRSLINCAEDADGIDDAFSQDQPPLGFNQEILDALDHVRRYRAHLS
jgi:radical SAM superfamily enzyme YgiQ (UPF0313 family)